MLYQALLCIWSWRLLNCISKSVWQNWMKYGVENEHPSKKQKSFNTSHEPAWHFNDRWQLQQLFFLPLLVKRYFFLLHMKSLQLFAKQKKNNIILAELKHSHKPRDVHGLSFTSLMIGFPKRWIPPRDTKTPHESATGFEFEPSTICSLIDLEGCACC